MYGDINGVGQVDNSAFNAFSSAYLSVAGAPNYINAFDVFNLGQIMHHRHLPPLMALADIFVQPGASDPFNDYRFPSKLPEFFSIGRPVVLPRTNLGAQVRNGIDAYVLERADAAGIAGAIVELRSDRALYNRLSQGAVAYAETHFSWRRSAETLATFYSTLTG